jgi:putative peptidoglycan lipid II flippase
VRVHPGDRIDDRYLVYEQTDENWGVCGWRAHDEVLGRDVLLTTFHPEDPRAESLVAAARTASRVNDHRFVRVLDAQIAHPTGFLVREWVGGRTLADLVGSGPLPEDFAVTIARDVAQALARAHAGGQAHLCVDPTSVVITDDGSVRIRGLGTAAVLRGVQPSPAGAARDDTTGVGRVLYAALTARSASGPVTGVPAARRVDAGTPAPRQVRAGVSPLLDAITVRALGSGRSHRFAPYPSPADVARALDRVRPDTPGPPNEPAMATVTPELDVGVVDPVPVPARSVSRPALDPTPGHRQPTDPAPPRDLPPAPAEPAGRTPAWLRLAGIVAAIAMGVGIVLLGVELIAANRVPDLDPDATPLATDAQPDERPADDEPALPAAVQVVQARDYDPLGNGSENPDQAPLAIDGDSETAWPTQTYFDPLEQQKAGVGLLLDLGRQVEVSAVDLTLVGQSSDVEVLLAPADSVGPPPTPDGFTLLGRVVDAGTTVSVTGDPATTQYVLVWFTRLPPVEDGWRGGIADAVVGG